MAAALPFISLGVGLLSSVQQQKAGQQNAEGLAYQGEFNAQIYEQQAEMIKEKKKLNDVQFQRAVVRSRGAIVSRTAGAGFTFGGSPMAIAIDNETQMRLDNAVDNYNLDVEANFARSGAIYQRATATQQVNLAKSTGNSNAFSTLMNTGSQFGMNYLGPRTGKL